MCTGGLLNNPMGFFDDPLKETRTFFGKSGDQKASPRPDLERLKAEADATISSNNVLAQAALRKRKAAGKVESGGNLDGAPSTVLGSGGY